MVTADRLRQEIESRLGFFPPFFQSALAGPAVLENLWRHTVSAYLDNPIGPLFKRRLVFTLSRDCARPHRIVCHSCALWGLRADPAEVLRLLEMPPPAPGDPAAVLGALLSAPATPGAWPPDDTPLAGDLHRAAVHLFRSPERNAEMQSEIRRIVGPALYEHLASFLAYVRACHTWVEQHPELAANAKRGVGDYLPPALARDARVVELFLTESERVAGENAARQRVEVERGATGPEAVEERTLEESRINATLYHLGVSFARELDPERLVKRITDALTTLTGARIGVFFFARQAGAPRAPHALAGIPRDAFAGALASDVRRLVRPALRGEGPVRLGNVAQEAPSRRPRRAPALGSCLSMPVAARSGQVLGVLFFGHDQPGWFTEQHERIVGGIAPQAAIAFENARLYKALLESEERARAAYALARQADRRKDEFLAMLGHELRNPLAPILTALELMKLRRDGTAGREVNVIERQVQHMVRLVDDLLDISRITRGKVSLRKEPTEIAPVIAKAIEMASPLFEQRSHHLEVAVPPEGLGLEADQVRLAQVFSNLLSNAAKYTEPGGHISIRADRQGDQIVVGVQDDGVGIAPELLPQIFELFTQGDRSLDRSGGGLGIGLTLVKSLIDLHGGTAAAFSEGLGKGSEFRVTLPALVAMREPLAVAADRGLHVAEAGDGAAGRQHGRRVLVVDDNRDAAELLATVLRSFGHEVTTAGNGLEALALADQFEPEVAVLDIGLPVMDGYELARRLRERVGPKPLRLVAVTGYGQEHDLARSREAGFDEHCVKPVDVERLAAAVAETEEEGRLHTG